ncbi:MAG: fumarylacetoacetate hydrolase family protein [Chloroflexota bacterium]
MTIVRFSAGTRPPAWGVTDSSGGVHALAPLRTGAIGLFQLSLADLKACVEEATQRPGEQSASILAPLDTDMEVWAAGVTYKRSEQARMEESETPDIYSRVYAAERPELFFKATPRRVSGDGMPLAIRADSSWDVPEPELAVVANAGGEIVGYTIGNDMSSRSIEGENPLYLPQAKVYAGCCGLGPGITPAWDVPDPYRLGITMEIRRDGPVCWRGATNTSELNRRLDDLVAHLFREDTFPAGVILSTGTALVPDSPFTLAAGDVVSITIDGLGTLSNPVVRGKQALTEALMVRHTAANRAR